MKNNKMTNEQLCVLIQKNDNAAKEELIRNNIGFIRKTVNEIYNGGYSDIDYDDLVQEGCIALLNAASSYETERGTFLSYAAPAVRNTILDILRAKSASCEQQMIRRDGFRLINLDDCIPGKDSLRYAETIVDPFTKSPEQVVIEAETIREMYAALRSIDERKRSYLLYRYGFIDGDEHLISDTAEHFHLSESRARSTEQAALGEMRTRMMR